MSFQQRQAIGHGGGSIVLTAIATVFGAVIGIFAVAVGRTLVGAGRLSWTGLSWCYGKVRRKKKAATAGAPHQTGESEIRTETKDAMGFHAGNCNAWTRRFDEVTHKRVKIGTAVQLDLWFYPHQQLVSRTLRFKNAKLAKKFGPRIKLADLPLDTLGDQEVHDRSVAEAERIIAEATKPKASPEIGPVKSVPTGGATMSDADNKQPCIPVAQAPQVIAPEKVNQAPIVVRPPRKKEVTYRGRLEKFGTEERRDVHNGGAYRCFCIHIDDWALGTVHDIVGTDLERAIREAGARVGDAIEVSLAGEIKTPVGGGKVRTKKVWNIVKIDSQS